MTPEQIYTIGNSLFISPHEWVLGKYTLRHEPSGFELWIANGPSHYYSYKPIDEPVCKMLWWLRPHYRFMHRAINYRRRCQFDRIFKDML